MSSSSAKDDEAPVTPRNTTPAPSRDTERDLEPLARESIPRDTDHDKTPGSNTLLSVRAQAAEEAERQSLHTDELERRITQLEARIKVLELQRASGIPADRRWMIWVALLAALALGWQLRAFLR